MPQQPSPSGELIYTPGVGFKFIRPGESPDAVMTPPELEEPAISDADIGAGIGAGLELAGGLIPGLGLGGRLLTGAATGALTGALSEEANPLEHGAANAALEFAGPIGEKLARGGLWLALKTSGAAKDTAEKTGEIVDAFLRERQRRLQPSELLNVAGRGEVPGGIPVGNQTRVESQRRITGQALEDAENAVLPGDHPVFLPGVMGAGVEQFNRSINADRPMDAGMGIIQDERDFVSQHLRRRGWEPWMSVREAGELGRHQMREGREVLNARANNEWVTPDDRRRAQSQIGRGERLFELQDQAAAGHGVSMDAVKKERERFSDLSKMSGANKRMRRGVSAAGIRGGTGSGTALSLAGILAASGVIPWSVVPIITGAGGLAGTFASPGNLSRAGFMAERTGRVVPSATRALEVKEAFDPDKELKTRSGVRRRAPR